MQAKGAHIKNYVFQLIYQGTSFFGWQTTREGPSIEETFLNALKPLFKEHITLQAASRTDRGVHAKCQVVNLLSKKSLSLKKLCQALNALLPPTLQVVASFILPESFHPTLDVAWKRYLYQIETSPVILPHLHDSFWHIPYPLDKSLMQFGAHLFIGSHNFKAFCSKPAVYSSYERTIEACSFEENDSQLCFEVKAPRFLFRMVRNMVGYLVSIGRHKREISHLNEALCGKESYMRALCAPAHGLVLNEIKYLKESWKPLDSFICMEEMTLVGAEAD